MDETSTNHFVVTHNGDFEAFIKKDPLHLEKTKWQQVERKMMDFRSGNTFDPSDDFDVVAAADRSVHHVQEDRRGRAGPLLLSSRARRCMHRVRDTACISRSGRTPHLMSMGGRVHCITSCGTRCARSLTVRSPGREQGGAPCVHQCSTRGAQRHSAG